MSQRLEPGSATVNIRRQIRIQKMSADDLKLVQEKLLYTKAVIEAGDRYAQAIKQAGKRLRNAIRNAFPVAEDANIAAGIRAEDISFLDVVTAGSDREELAVRLGAVEEAIKEQT
jgi:hypothetical protein